MGSQVEAGLSQEELGYETGLHRNYIGGVERGELNASFASIIKLAAGFGISPSELLALGEKLQRSRARLTIVGQEGLCWSQFRLSQGRLWSWQGSPSGRLGIRRGGQERWLPGHFDGMCASVSRTRALRLLEKRSAVSSWPPTSTSLDVTSFLQPVVS